MATFHVTSYDDADEQLRAAMREVLVDLEVPADAVTINTYFLVDGTLI